jgi:hypothetical protein
MSPDRPRPLPLLAATTLVVAALVVFLSARTIARAQSPAGYQLTGSVCQPKNTTTCSDCNAYSYSPDTVCTPKGLRACCLTQCDTSNTFSTPTCTETGVDLDLCTQTNETNQSSGGCGSGGSQCCDEVVCCSGTAGNCNFNTCNSGKGCTTGTYQTGPWNLYATCTP